ncbi:hypothetical protein ACO0R3_004095 [Hanseniaspora guilliermondii]
MNNFNQNSASNKRQKTKHDPNDYINVPIHLLPLVSTNNKKIVIPDPLPQSVSLLRPPSYSVRKYLSNMSILRVYEIVNLLSFTVKQATNVQKLTKDRQQFYKSIEPCIAIVDKMFAPYGSIHYAISPNQSNSKIRTFELSVLSFLYFFKQWLCNMVNADLEFFVSNVKAQVLNNGTIYVESNDFTIIKNYPDGSRTIKKFNCKLIFDSWLKIEFFELVRLSAESFASKESLSSNNLNKDNELDALLDFILKRKQHKEKMKNDDIHNMFNQENIFMDQACNKTNGTKRSFDDIDQMELNLEKKQSNSDYSSRTAVPSTNNSSSEYNIRPSSFNKYPFPNYKLDAEGSPQNFTNENTPHGINQIKAEHFESEHFSPHNIEQSEFMKNHPYNKLAAETNGELSDSELLGKFLKSKVECFNLDSEYNTPATFLKMLQLADVMTNLKNLMLYQKINGVQSPMDAMFNFVDDLRKREKELVDK